MKVAIISSLGVAALAFALSASHLLGPDELQAEIDQAEAKRELQTSLQARPDLLQDMQDAAPGSAQHRAAAAAFCRHAKGRSAQLSALPDGSLACRGATVLADAKGGAL